MSRARTWRSYIAGPTIKSIGCRRWRPIWSAAGRGDRHDGGPPRHWRPRRRPRRSRSSSSTGEDPVKLGLVASLARPGGNLTGFNFFSGELTAKRLELLRELVPRRSRCRARQSDHAATSELTLRDVEPAARAMGLQIQVSTPAPAARSMRPSRPSRASGPTRSSSAPILSSPAGASNWPIWRRATRSPRSMRRVNMSKSAG